jgi:hypothetical protein
LLDKGLLDGDCMTVTGKTLAENLASSKGLAAGQKIIQPVEHPIKPTGHITILHGNLAPGSAVAKITGKEGSRFRGPARVFDSEEAMLAALEQGVIKRGDVVIIRYEGPKGGPGMPEMLTPTSALVGAGLGNDVALLVDGNSCYSPARAIEVGRMLEDNGVSHFEEPCPYWEMEQTRQVTEALSLDVTGGEQDWDMQHWKRMVGMRAVDIIQPDVLYMGGMVRTLRVAALGASAGLPCTPHSANLSMVTLFTMHLLRAIPNAGKYLELSIEGPEYYPWQQDLFVKDPYGIVDGKATVTEEPGWGVEINPEWLARSIYQCSELNA